MWRVQEREPKDFFWPYNICTIKDKFEIFDKWSANFTILEIIESLWW